MRRTAVNGTVPLLRMLLAGWLLLAALLAPSGALFAGGQGPAAPLLLDGSCARPRLLSGHMEVLEDPSGRMGLEEAVRTVRFTPLSGHLDEGYSDAAYWLRFRLERGAGFPASCWLRLDAVALDSIRSFVQLAGSDPARASSYRAWELGLSAPFPRRPLRTPLPAVPVEFGTEDAAEVYLRVASSTPVQLAGEVLTGEEMAAGSRNHVLLQSIFLGIVAVAASMSLLVFLSVRDRVFLFFSLYGANLFLAYMVLRGMHSLLLPHVAHLLTPALADATIGAGVAFFALLALAVSREVRSRREALCLRFMVGVGAVDAVSLLLWGPTVLKSVATAATLGFLAVLLRMAFRLRHSLSPGMKVLAGAFGINIVLYILFFLQGAGMLPWEPRLLDVVQLFALLHCIAIFILLIERTLRAERKLQHDMQYAEEWATAMAENRTRDLRSCRDELELSLFAEQRSAERLKKFLSMVSHEYRTPLAIIQGNLDIIARQALGRGAAEPAPVAAMRRAGSKLMAVMEGAMERSRLLESAETGRKGRARVGPYLRRQVESAGILWPGRTMELVCLAGEEEVEGDLLLLDMALFNILDNAMKYSPETSQVSIRCRVEAGSVAVDVENETTAPPDESERALFSKFYRGKNSSSQKGDGIGLWMVQEIVRQHGGTVVFECDKKGRVHVGMRLPLAGGGQ